MKTLVGILLTMVLAVGYKQADAQMCKSKHKATKHKTEKVAMTSNKHKALETRCVCHAVSSKSEMMSAKSYGGYKKVKTNMNNGILNNGGSPLMPNIQLNRFDTVRLKDGELNNDLNRKDLHKPIISNGWENSGLDFQR